MQASSSVADTMVRPRSGSGLARYAVVLAVAAFVALCTVVLSTAPRLAAPDDYAYRASVVAVTDGHLLTLSTGQVRALAAQLTRSAGPSRAVLTGPSPLGGSIEQWVRLPSGRWISEKNPGYPFLAAPFQALGVIRLAPLFYAALGCLGLFAGARRWLGWLGGTAAVWLFCSSGAAMLFAWRDYMPTFIDASLIAAGTGALLWALLAERAAPRRRTTIGLLAFVAMEAAVFTRYTDVVVLGCATVTVLVLRWRIPARIPAAALRWWLGSVVLFAVGVAAFNDLVYGGPLASGYRPGEVTFSLGAIPVNLRSMPAHLIQAMPMLALGLTALAWICARGIRWRRAGTETDGTARPDLAVAVALAASWAAVWGLYAAYTWTTQPGLSTVAAVRFYVPALGPIALLGAWLLARGPLLVRSPRGTRLAAAAAAAIAITMFGLGGWAFSDMPSLRPPTSPPGRCNIGEPGCPTVPGPASGYDAPFPALAPRPVLK
jgi:hypothetical protein